VKALARAFRYQRLLDEGRYASISEIAGVERIERGYLGRILQLTLLAPDIIEAVLDGQQSTELALPALLKPFPADWARQRNHVFDACRSANPAAPQPPAAALIGAADMRRVEPPRRSTRRRSGCERTRSSERVIALRRVCAGATGRRHGQAPWHPVPPLGAPAGWRPAGS
jgi:hypothetical protein